MCNSSITDNETCVKSYIPVFCFISVEENVGWRPDAFKDNHTIATSIVEIRKFFNGKYEPIYVPTKDHLVEVGLALSILYEENGMNCPFIESYDDWGKHCLLYQLEYLVSAVIMKINMDTSRVIEIFKHLSIESNV